MYHSSTDGVWLVKSREKLVLGKSTVSFLLPVNREMLAVCEVTLYAVNASLATDDITSTNSSKLQVSMVRRHLFVRLYGHRLFGYK